MRGRFAFLLLAMMMARPMFASEFLVAPLGRADVSGNHGDDQLSYPRAVQNVFLRANFSEPIWISAVAFRLDDDLHEESFAASIPRVKVRMTTYAGTFSSFSTSYDQNRGADDLTLFDGALSWSSRDLPGAAANPFDLKIKFTQPFFYDPGKGDLLMLYDSTDGAFSNSLLVDAQAYFGQPLGWYGLEPGNIITQFEVTAIPEPSIWWLALSGALFLGFARRSFSSEAPGQRPVHAIIGNDLQA